MGLSENQIDSSLQKAILESFQDGLFTIDRNWQYSYVNESAARMVGKEVEDLVGKKLFDVFPEVVETEFYQYYKEVMENGTPLSFDQEYAPLKKWFKGNIYPYDNGITIVFTDNTDRKKMEIELAEYAKRLEW